MKVAVLTSVSSVALVELIKDKKYFNKHHRYHSVTVLSFDTDIKVIILIFLKKIKAYQFIPLGVFMLFR